MAALKVRNSELSYHVLRTRADGAGGRTRSSRRHVRSSIAAAGSAAASEAAAHEAAAGDGSGELLSNCSRSTLLLLPAGFPVTILLDVI